jgi:hypothetical protein
MRKVQPIIARIITIFLSLVLLLSSPAAVFASEISGPAVAAPTGTTNSSQSDPVVPTAGVNRPTGASAATYHYNPANGLWENDYYTWNPATKETVARTAPEYTYNPQTAMWDTSVWEYQTSSSTYVLVPHSVATPPTGAVTHGGPVVTPAATTSNTTAKAAIPLASSQSATDSSTAALNSQPAGTTAGDPASAGSTRSDTNATGVVLGNTVNSDATSGNALLQSNMAAGDAISGDASAFATVLNLLQSSSSLTGSGLTTFTKNIQGDVNGDLLIDPAALTQPANIAPTTLNNLTLNSSLDAGIQNNISLDAASGNADVLDNTHAGDAITGDANAVANVINMINSVVAANQSFLGVVNIYGNFSGDIVVPTSSLNALLASNADSPSAGPTTPTLTATSDSTQQIMNNIDLAAASGKAVQTSNTTTGSALSGDALTKLTIFNLTGRKVTAANSLLVFVNVLGTWVGVIMDAPVGATTAALTGDATSASTAPSMDSNPVTADVHQNDKESIINNITAHATSGNATVQDNFSSGNAVSGSAHASANIFNMLNSQFSLSHWFGILFINVFGAWHGNFGTAKPPVAPSGSTSSATGTTGATTTGRVQVGKVFRFVPSGISATPVSRSNTGGLGGTESYDQLVDSVGQVLAAQDIVQKVQAHKVQPAHAAAQPKYALSALPIVVGLTGLVAVGVERVKSARGKLFRRFR